MNKNTYKKLLIYSYQKSIRYFDILEQIRVHNKISWLLLSEYLDNKLNRIVNGYEK